MQHYKGLYQNLKYLLKVNFDLLDSGLRAYLLKAWGRGHMAFVDIYLIFQVTPVSQCLP